MNTTKIYGNSSSDGFGLYMGLITVLFVAGGIGLAKVGGIVMLIALPVFVVLCALMAVKLGKWDVMSDLDSAPVAKVEPVKVVTFPVVAQSDSKPSPTAAPWAPSKGNETSLPGAVMKPKSAVETNTNVA